MSGSGGSALAPSPSRTLYIDGRVQPPGPLAWPNKSAGSQLDYSFDFSGFLQDAFGGAAGAINPESIVVALTGDGQLNVVSQTLVGTALIFIFSAGTPGQQYSCAVTVQTTATPVLVAACVATITINQVPNQ